MTQSAVLTYFKENFKEKIMKIGADVLLTSSIFAILFLSLFIIFYYQSHKIGERSHKRVIQAELKADQNPDEIKPTWDLARITLEAYFNRNLSQVTAIFWLSTTVMFAGFGIILWGVLLALQNSTSNVNNLPAVVTGLAGVVTELIGATFLFVYRSTIQQAGSYTKTLERINSVGMAMQILDSIPEDAQVDSIKHSTKALLARVLIGQSFNASEDKSQSSSDSSNPQSK
jgi:hypothetical protein